ncbi:hypothetical protein QT922_017995 [Xanthomonas campestris pv. campestris]|uniref:hypothetical protein n=1 Tax=Xanthomonas campestris TaxID=339 RepID=UPI0025A14332|nr:hypothetical protein [Xanthomonas campestris]MDM7672168.1 hypothetical protein [Xanthomonas campestris pv. campestris]MDM7682709.1 hypothetical protein [Xanthomonas campestris pv. campestris]
MQRFLLILMLAGITPINPLIAIYAHGRGMTWAVLLCILWSFSGLAMLAKRATKGRSRAAVPDTRD